MNPLVLKRSENEDEKVWLGQIIGRSTFLRNLFHNIANYLILRSWYIRKEIKLWAKTAPDVVNILDSGSGFGQCAYSISSINPTWNIFSLDINRDKVCQCNTFFNKIGRQNVVFKTTDIQDFVMPEAYDLVLSIDVLNYIKDDKKVLENIYQSLKPKGTFLLSVPTNYSDFDAFPIQSHKYTLQPARKGYKKKELTKKVKECGFSIQHATYTYGKTGKLAYQLSILFPLKILQLSKVFAIIIPFYLLLFLPLSFLLNIGDMFLEKGKGKGLIIKAIKN